MVDFRIHGDEVQRDPVENRGLSRWLIELQGKAAWEGVEGTRMKA